MMCNCLQELKEKTGADLPFEKPILLRKDSLDVITGEWAVRLMKKTSRGNPTLKKSVVVYLNYCPVCGEKMRDK